MSQRAAKIKACRKVSLSSHVWACPDAKICMGFLAWHTQTCEESDILRHALILAALCDIYDGRSAGYRL